MESYLAKFATVVNSLKNNSAGRMRELKITKKDDREFTLFTNLPVELRLKIWAFCYLLPQPPRIVEVRTQEHDNCPGHEGFCPRYSPSRKHPLVNTCHEARSVARSEALKAGHMTFSSASPFSPSAEIIIFDPLSDLLYLPTEIHPLPLTRGPRGTYTQYKKSVSPWTLRSLAISIEPYGTQFNPMRCAIHDFPVLEDLFLVAPNWKRASEVWGLKENLIVIQRALGRRVEAMQRSRALVEFEEGQEGVSALGRRKWARVRVAVRCEGGKLEVLEAR